MSRIEPSEGYVEEPVFFSADGEDLFGIVARPPAGGATTGFIIFPGGGTPLSTNRNRLSVRICRELARQGIIAMRCDYHGTGESTGTVDQFRLDRPFVKDVVAATEILRRMGATRVLLAGSCFGGRSALAAAAQVPAVSAVMLLATSPRDYVMGERASANKAATWSLVRYVREALRPAALRGWLNPRLRRTYLLHARAKLRFVFSKLPGGRRRLQDRPMGTDIVSPAFERHLQAVVRRRVPVLLLYGIDDGFKDEFREAAAGPLRSLLDEAGELVEVRTIPGKLHGFTSLAMQDASFDEVVAWACAHASGAAGGRSQPAGSGAST